MLRQKKYFGFRDCSSGSYQVIKCKGSRQKQEIRQSSHSKLNDQYSIKEDQDSSLLSLSSLLEISIDKHLALLLCLFSHFANPNRSVFELSLQKSTGRPSELRFFIEKEVWQYVLANLEVNNIQKRQQIRTNIKDQLDKEGLIGSQQLGRLECLELFSSLTLNLGMQILPVTSLSDIFPKHLSRINSYLPAYILQLPGQNQEYLIQQLTKKIRQIYKKQSQNIPQLFSSDKIFQILGRVELNRSGYEGWHENASDIKQECIRKNKLILQSSKNKNEQMKSLQEIQCSQPHLKLSFIKIPLEKRLSSSVRQKYQKVANFEQKPQNLKQLNKEENCKNNPKYPSDKNCRCSLQYSKQLMNKLIQKLREGSINALRKHWLHGLGQYLEMLLDTDIWGGQEYQQLLGIFFQLIDYKLARYNLKFNNNKKVRLEGAFCKNKVKDRFGDEVQGSKAYRYDPSINLYQKCYPGIMKLSQRYFSRVNGKTFFQLWESYKAQAIKKINPHSKSIQNIYQDYHSQFIRELQIKENKLDQLLEKHLRVLKGNLLDQNSKVNSSNIDPQLIAETPQFHNTITLAKYLAQINNEAFAEQNKAKLSFVTNLQNEKFVQNRCLSCATFFYEGFNILDTSILSTPVKIYGSIKQISKIQVQLKKDICTLLNGQGGVILFGCKQVFQRIQTIGEVITQVQKDQYEQKIASFLKSFYPFIEINQNIQVTFVPVKQSPYLNQLPTVINKNHGEEAYVKQDERFTQRKLIKGRYVARIKVCGSKDRIYCWNSNQNYFCAIQKDKRVVQIKIKTMMKELKRRIKNKSSKTDADTILLSTPHTCFDHVCKPLDTCYQTSERQQGPQIIIEQNEDKYKQMSILIVQKKNIEEVELKLRRISTNILIKKQFQRYNFRYQKDTYVMYHNIHFNDLLLEIEKNKKDFTIDGRKLLVISITYFIKIQNKQNDRELLLNHQQMLQCQKHLSSVLPEEKIRFYKYKPSLGGQIQLYAQANTKRGSLYLYYLLNSQGIKALFKHPKDYPRWSDQDKKILLKEIDYDKKGFQ